MNVHYQVRKAVRRARCRPHSDGRWIGERRGAETDVQTTRSTTEYMWGVIAFMRSTAPPSFLYGGLPPARRRPAKCGWIIMQLVVCTEYSVPVLRTRTPYPYSVPVLRSEYSQ